MATYYRRKNGTIKNVIKTVIYSPEFYTRKKRIEVLLYAQKNKRVAETTPWYSRRESNS